MMEQLNYALFNLINQYAGLNPFIDALAIIMAKYMPVIIILGIAYLWIKNSDRTRDIVLYGIYASIIGLLINFIIGLVYFHPRPFMIPIGTLLFQYPVESSFPSDHTTLMISIALTMIYFKETRKIGIIFGILGLFGGIARVFAGLHFPFDILGSIGVSLIASLVIYYFKDDLNQLNRIIKTIYFKVDKKIRISLFQQ